MSKFRNRLWPYTWPKWLYPKGSDLLPFSDAELGRRLAHATRFHGPEAEEHRRAMAEAGRKGNAARVANSTHEQRSAWGRIGAKAGMAAMRNVTTREQRIEWARQAGFLAWAGQSEEERARRLELLRQAQQQATPEQRREWSERGWRASVVARAARKAGRQQGEGK